MSIRGEPGRGDRQREGKVAAQPNDLGRGGRVSADAVRAGRGGEQRDCVTVGQHGHRPARDIDEPAELMAGGDDRPAAPGRQQRAHLGLVPGIVEDEQRPPVGKLAAVERDAFIGFVGNRRAIDADRTQESPDHRMRVDGTQIGVQLAVRPLGAMTSREGQRGLADAAGTDEHTHRGLITRQHLADAVQQLGPADEPGIRRQLARHDADQCRAGGDGVATQDLCFQAAQRLSGFDAQLVDERPVHLPVVRQRVPTPTSAGQRPHPRGVEPFPVGMFGQERWHGPKQLVVTALSELDREQVLGDRQALLVQPRTCLRDQLVRRAGQRRAAPQCQRLDIAASGPFQLTTRGGLAPVVRQPTEVSEIQAPPRQAQLVATGPSANQPAIVR
jgi:hypothetical protein